SQLANVLAGDIFPNTTGIPLTVSYDVVPVSADACEGDMVRVILTVNPEPALNPNLDKPICSDVVSGIVLGVATGSVSAATYDITNINISAGLTADIGNATAGTGYGVNAIANDKFTNLTNAALTVVYDIVPISAAGCAGNTAQVTLTVNPEP
ncbi:unnamed protein product, partial [marine sediment metagenome]